MGKVSRRLTIVVFPPLGDWPEIVKLEKQGHTIVKIGPAICRSARQRSSGKNAEWGVGIHSFHHKLLWIVGPRTSVFHSLADKHFDKWQDVFDYLRQYGEIYR